MSTASLWPQRLADRFWRQLAFPFREVFANEDVAFERARVLVTITYVVWFVYSLSTLRVFANWNETPPQLLWNVAWFAHVPWRRAMFVLMSTAALSSLLAAHYPNVRLLRVLTLLAVFEYQGILYSRGKIDHANHTWLFALLLLVFLPRLSRVPTKTEKRAFLEIIWGIQAVALACYTVAGIQKLWGAWIDWGHGPTLFDPSSLAHQVAALTLHGDADGLLSAQVLAHPAWGYPLMMAALYLEVVAITVAFRPRLHATWGMGLMAMQTGIGLVMNIWFDPMILMIGTWFLLSPFATEPFELNATLRDLPWFGPALAAAQARLQRPDPGTRVVVFYDGDCGICSRFVRTLLYIGIPTNLYFAPQQGDTWQALVNEKPYLAKVDAVAVLNETGGSRRLYLGSEAILWTLTQLRFPFAFAWFGLWIPAPIRDIGYRLVASNRKALNGVLPGNACPLVPEELRERLLN